MGPVPGTNRPSLLNSTVKLPFCVCPWDGWVRPWDDCPARAVRKMFMCFMFIGFLLTFKGTDRKWGFFDRKLLSCLCKSLASRKRCDLKTRKRCDFFSAAQKIASDFSAIYSAIYSAIFWRFFCDFCGKTCDLVLCDLKTQRFFCDCDFLGR